MGDSASSSKSTLSKVGGVLATGAKNTVSGIGNFGKSAASRVTTSKKGQEEADTKEENQLLSQKIGSGVGRFLKGTAKRTKRVAATVGAGAKGFVKAASEQNAKTGRDENGEFHYDVESNEVESWTNEHGEGDGHGTAKERKRKHRNKKGRGKGKGKGKGI